MKDNSLIEQLIKDSSNKELISEGNFTLGELHSDRASLFVLIILLLNKIYSLKGYTVEPWYSKIDSEEGLSHIGLTLIDEESPLEVAGKFPTSIIEHFPKMKFKELKDPKHYKSFNETFKLFNF